MKKVIMHCIVRQLDKKWIFTRSNCSKIFLSRVLFSDLRYMKVFCFLTVSFTIKGGTDTLKLIHSGIPYKIKFYSSLLFDGHLHR